jgi:hypothetical protein
MILHAFRAIAFGREIYSQDVSTTGVCAVLSRLLTLAALLLLSPITSHADERGVPPMPGCAPQKAEELQLWRDWMRTLGHDWLVESRAAEADRIRDNPDVFRHLDRLYLAREDGGLVTLVDCPYGDGMYVYLYERYDAAGGFYVVGRGEYEDFRYILASRKTGLTFTIVGPPVWSPDGKRFANGRCNMMNGPNELYVVRPVDDGLRTEKTVPMPCSTGECTFSWESDSAIAISCTDLQGAVPRTLRVVLQGDAWTVVPN